MSAVTHDSHLQDCLYISWHPTMTVLLYRFIGVRQATYNGCIERSSFVDIQRSASSPLRLSYKYQTALNYRPMENSPFLYSSRRVSLPWFIVFEFKLARVVSYPSLDEWIIKRSTSAIGTFFSRPSEEKPRSNGAIPEKKHSCSWKSMSGQIAGGKNALGCCGPGVEPQGQELCGTTMQLQIAVTLNDTVFFFFSIYLLTSLTNNDHGDPLTLSLIFQQRFFFFVRFFWKRFQGLIYNTSVIFESRELFLPRHILSRTFKQHDSSGISIDLSINR